MNHPARAAGELYLGFDYGLRRIGVAVGDSLTRLARPLPTLDNKRTPDWEAVEKALKQWRPSACIVGLPLDLDGNPQTITQQAEAFARQLRNRYGVPVYFCDERLSSRAADDEIREARADGRMKRRTRKGDRDGVAARLILEQWLSAQIVAQPVGDPQPGPPPAGGGPGHSADAT